MDIKASYAIMLLYISPRCIVSMITTTDVINNHLTRDYRINFCEREVEFELSGKTRGYISPVGRSDSWRAGLSSRKT